MEKTFTKLEDLAAHIKEYVNNRVSSIKLSVAEKTSKILANLIAASIVIFVFFFFIIFISIAIAFAFAKLTGEYYWGFLIVAGIYLLMGIIVWALKDKLLRFPIMNSMLKQLFNEENDEDQEHQTT